MAKFNLSVNGNIDVNPKRLSSGTERSSEFSGHQVLGFYC